jgi:UDP-N-acetylmuramate dehydrogenase
MEGITGTFLEQLSLASYTSWHIGGPAQYYFKPSNLDDLSYFLQQLWHEHPQCPLWWLGLGSNVLIADQGLSGVVIHTQGALVGLERLERTLVRVEAGVTCAKFARYCAAQGWPEAAFFAGIPGTMGGALAMNAGAFGGETWKGVCAVEVMNRQGQRKQYDKDQYTIGYRSVQSPMAEEWFVAGYFQFELGEVTESQAYIRQLLRQRSEQQPIGVFSCGSVFRNPAGRHAGQLIDSLKLKGYCVGGVEISTKHANFIINRGSGTAAQIIELIVFIQERVLQQHGILLEPEVRMLGI